MSRYRWVVVATAAIGLSVSFSPVFLNTLPVFLKAIVADTGWSRTQVVSGISAATLVVTLSSAFTGRLVDRFGPRRVIACSTVPFAIALAAMRYIGVSYPGYLVLAGFIGFVGNCANTFVYLCFMPRWFDRKLGLSLGLAASGVGLGQTLNPLAASFLLGRFGWRDAYVVLGAAVVIVTLLCVAVLRDQPSRSLAAAEAGARTAPLYGFSFREAVRTAVFWRLLISIVLATSAVTGCTLSMVPLLTDRGLTLEAAAKLAASTGSAVIVGRLLTGVLLDRAGSTVIARVMFFLAAGAILLLAFGGATTSPYVLIVILGLALGGEGDVLAYAVRSAFGTRAYGQIYGVLFGAFNAGVLLGPLLMGLSYDRLGSYQPMLVAFSVFAVIAAIIFSSGKAFVESDLLSTAPEDGRTNKVRASE